MNLSFFGKNWQYRHQKDLNEDLFDTFLKARTLEPTEDFLSPEIVHLSDPKEFPEAEKAKERVYEAIRNNQKILVFGDYDLDGISGAAILFTALKKLGANVAVWLPSREDGFGLTAKFAEAAIKKEFNLVITTDCGISDYDSVSKLQEAGIDVIITDHHSVPAKTPPYYAVLHPLYPVEQKTPFSGAGVALKFAQILLDNNLPAELIEFATLGTIADIVPLRNENRVIVSLGLKYLKNTQNIGLKRLFETAGIKQQEIDAEKVAFFLAPRLNAAGRLDHPMEALALLLGKVENATLLDQINSKRQLLTNDYLEQILKNIDETEPAFVIPTTATAGIIGLLAGRLQEQHSKPIIVLSEEENEYKASCRGPEDFHFAQALRELSHYFSTFGGHAQAAGFSITKDNFQQFKDDFNKLVIAKRGEKPPAPNLYIDAVINPTDLNIQAIEKLLSLAPFGEGFSQPVFSIKSDQITDIRTVGKANNHLSFRVNGISAIAFSCAQAEEFLGNNTGEMEIAFSPDINLWNNQKQISIKVVDFRLPL